MAAKDYITHRNDLIDNVVKTLKRRLAEVDATVAENVEKSIRKAVEKVLAKFEEELVSTYPTGKGQKAKSVEEIANERLSTRGASLTPEGSPRGPGRPPGARNKKGVKTKSKSGRGPGRPPGAKNKKKSKRSKVEALPRVGDDGLPLPPRGRGRPPKDGVARQVYQSTGRPRGRPSRDEIAQRITEAQQAAKRAG